MGLRDIGARLPPGFRFYPSDEELVCHYLYKKVANEEALKPTSLVEIDLHTCEPWQLPEVAKLNNTEWYFFSFRDRKYATGFRTNRATTSGYWKATGKDRVILDPRTRKIVGMRKTLVFYQNRAPNGIKTGWIMHEFRLESPNMPPKEDWVLCRVFHKSKEESNNANNNMQMMVDHHIINGGKTTNSSPPPPFNSVTSTPPPPPPPPPPPAPPTTLNWGLSSSISCQKQQEQKPTMSLISSNIIPPSSTPQKQPHTSNVFISSSPLNPSYHGEKDDEHFIIKVASSNYLSSFTDLINSNTISDDVYGFLWDMDLDQGSSIADALDDGVLISLPPLPEPNHNHDHKDMGKVGFDDANHLR